MDTIKNYYSNHPWSISITAWLLFSLFYGYSAYYKPFTPNEFMSWVYSSRCNYFEILTLRDEGIGHPPLFHILQKMVQDFLPGYHFLHVRLLNYILGSVFIVLLAQYLTRFKKHFFFILSISISAAVLNTFIYARMWGGMALLSIFLVIIGESYVDTNKKINLLLMVLIVLIGLFFDYNFILMLPYSFFIFFNYSKNQKKLQILAFSSLILIWIVAFIISINKFGLSMSIYTNLINIYKMGFNLFNLFFYAWYIEIIVLIMIFFTWTIFFQYQKKEFNEFHTFLSIILFLGFIFLFINNGNLRIRYAFFFLPLPIIYYFLVTKKLNFESYNIRYILSIIFGSTIILSISPLFWRDLLINRFIVIFLPLIIMIIYRNFSDRILTLISTYLILSGITFSFSSYLNNFYLPETIQADKEVIFEGPSFYASQYLKNDIFLKEDVKFLSLKTFDSACRVCAMGTDEIDFSQIDSIVFISYNQIPIKLLLKGYKINKSEIFGITELDKFQLKHLTPLNKNYSILYKMVKDNEENE